MISTFVHGVIDYLFAVMLIASPWIFGFREANAQTYVADIIAVIVIAYGLLTRYELGIVKLIPFRMHLIFDIIVNLILLCSPWLFGFSNLVHLPHVILGLTGLLVVALTKKIIDKS